MPISAHVRGPNATRSKPDLEGDGRQSYFLGIGQTARDCRGYEEGDPIRGLRSAATTTRLADRWDHAHRYLVENWSGSMPFGDAMERATQLAKAGFA